MANRRNQHVYNPDEIERAKGIPLDPKLKCCRCLKLIPQAMFSAKQLTDARVQKHIHGRIIKGISCKSCTGQQILEIECIMCHKTKGLENFAKSQRNKPDSAKCFDCMETQVAEDAVNEHKYKNIATAFITPDHSNGNVPEYFTSAASTTDSYGEWSSVNGDRKFTDDEKDGGISLVGAMRGMKFNDTTTDTLIDTSDGQSNKNGGWNTVCATSWHTQSHGPASGTTPLRLNGHGKSSIPAASESYRSFSSSHAERSLPSEYGNSGFIKKSAIPRGTTPPAWSQNGPMRLMGDAQREYEEDVEDNDQDDDADAWSSDDETEI